MKEAPSPREPFLAIQKLASDLRDPDGGCPWDIAQNHQTVITNLIEETYEVVDALEKIDIKNPDSIEHLKEELGDLVFQIVFHTQLAREQDHFTLDDVFKTVIEKLIFRHPHVYGEANKKLANSDEVLKNWEKLKRNEKRNKNEESMLSSVPDSLPALLKAYRLGEKVARVGFDWSSSKEIIDKISEETEELQEEISKKTESFENFQRIEEEFGDLLFVLAQYARFLKVDPEKSLQKANQKFMKRFNYMEKYFKKQLADEEEIPIDEWEKLWQQAKKNTTH